MDRRSLIPALLATLLVSLVGCSTSDRVVSVHGIVVVEPKVVDFGRVALGSSAVREVRVRNVVRAPLELRSFVLGGEGGDLEVTSRGGPLLRGGQTATLVLRFTPTEERILERTLELATSDPVRAELSLPITGVGVLPRVSVDPARIDFGRIELGEVERRAVTLRNEFDVPVDVVLERHGDEQFGLAGQAAVTVPGSRSLDVPLEFAPAREGEASARLVISPCATCAQQEVQLVGTGLDRALVVIPDPLDFGYVAVDRRAEREFQVTNAGTRPLEVTALELVGASPAFELDELAQPVVLQEGEAIRLKARFTPSKMGEDGALIRIASSSRRAPSYDLRVVGIGGGPEIKVTPNPLAFGEHPYGARPYMMLTVSNIGADGAGPGVDPPPPLQILGITSNNPKFGSDDEAWPPIPAGAELQVPIFYDPTEESMAMIDEGTITIESNDGAQPFVDVAVSGTAFRPPACEGLEIVPELLDFGTLDLRRGAVLSFKIVNTGGEACILRDLDIAEGSDPVFFIDRVESFVVRPNGWFGWLVGFDPFRAEVDEGEWIGEVELFTANAADPDQARQTVQLRARSADGCLVPSPRFLDFGNDPSGCGSREGNVAFENVCTYPTLVDSIVLGPGSTPGEFELLRAPPAPFAVQPGEEFTVDVRWLSESRGINSAPLYVAESSRIGPLMVPVLGELTAEGAVSDRFVATAPGKTDVLLVIDNSSTMREEQGLIAGAVGALVERGDDLGVDYHLGVTTTGVSPPTDASLPACPGGANGAEAGRLFPVDGSRPRIVTPATPNGAQVLAENTQVGLCQQVEEGLEAMKLALSEPNASGSNAGFQRDDANLAVIFVSEEDDRSGFAVAEYRNFLVDTKGQGGALVSAIVDTNGRCTNTTGVARRYLELVGDTGGIAHSICAGGWEAAFVRIADQAYAERDAYVLSEVPDGTGIEVLVDGAAPPASAWRYDPATNSISFTAGSRPRPGQVIRVNYVATCR